MATIGLGVSPLVNRGTSDVGLLPKTLFAQQPNIPGQSETVIPNYGLREDGTPKGNGWLGPLPMQNGSNKIATEISIGVNFDGQERLIPLLVPTLDKSEIDYLLKGNKPTETIINKAVKHGRERIRAGQSPFKD